MRTSGIYPTVRSNLRLVLLGALAVLLLAGCGNVFRASIQGRVIDSEDDSGINRATVRVYEEEPSNPDSGGFLVQTRTRTSGGTDGVFDTGIVWRESFAAFGDYGTEAGGTTLWLGVTYERQEGDDTGYEDAIFEAAGILSDENNIVGDLALTPTVVSGEVSGTVVDEDDNAVAGAFVDITVTDTFDEDGNSTGDEDDVDAPDNVGTGPGGGYSFTVEWPRNSDIEEVRLELKFYPDGDAADADEERDDPDDEKSVRVRKDEESTVGDATVDPEGTDPSATVQGQVVQDDSADDSDTRPYSGAVIEFEVIEVTLENDGTSTDQDEVDVPTSVTSDFNGVYTVTVEWPADSEIEEVKLKLRFYEDQDAADEAEDDNGDPAKTRTVKVEDGETRTVSDVDIYKDNDDE